MQPGQSIDIQLLSESGELLRLSDVMVEIKFFMGGRYRYGFKVGRTDELGHLRVSYDEIEVLRREDAQENLMDYNTLLNNCDKDVEVAIPTEMLLREQVKNVVRFYGQSPLWANNWPANAKIEASAMMCRVESEITYVHFRAKFAGDVASALDEI